MRRTFNYTNRQRIARSGLAFSLHRTAEGRRYFDASIDLGDVKVDSGARVFVEAFYNRSLARFDFGTASAMQPPEDRWLDEVDFADRLSFRVKVVDESGSLGRILALADGIDVALEPEESGGRRSILPVSYTDALGEELWRVHFSVTGPVLEVNRSVPGIKDIVEKDSVFAALVRPQAMRDVLVRILLVDEGWTLEDASDETWQGRWLRFGRAFNQMPLDSTAPDDEIGSWINEAVSAFARHVDARAGFVASLASEE